MFPFLGPVRQANHVEIQGTLRCVEITFLADSPLVSRANSAASAILPRQLDKSDALSQKSKSNEGLNINPTGSRPGSRAKSKTSVSSQSTSARSEKSSQAPVKETIPPPSRHKNKGLEMSSAMMEMFGGNSSPFGPNSSFKPIENHDAAYDRAVRRARGDRSDLSQPGPEWYEGFEKLDMTGIDLPPDPNCPAEKLLKSSKNGETSEKSTPDADSDWREAKEDVFRQKPKFESLPGPDIGADEDEEENEEEEVLVDSSSPVDEKGEKDDVEDDPVDGGEGGGSSAPQGRNSAERREANGESGDADDEDSQQRLLDEKNDKAAAAGAGEKASGSGGGDMSILHIKNAQIINDDSIFVADVLIQDGVIQNVGSNLETPEGAEVIDASGKMVLPAGIDVHTQITSPDSADDLATGCRSALAGGTATIVEMVSTRTGESPSAAFKRVKSSLDKASCNVSLSVSINNWNESIKSDMEKLVSDGVNSFVVDVDSDDKLFSILEHGRKLGAHIRILPENKSIVSILEKKMLSLGVSGPEGYPQSRPETLESDKVNNVCVMSQLANCPISILSVSSAESLNSIEKARSNGTLAHAEIASVAVAADGNGYSNKDLKIASTYLTEVPLRKDATDRLISALNSAPLVVCSSAHKPVQRSVGQNFTQMAKGSTGAEERMSIIWEKGVRSGKIDPMRFVAVTSSNAAKIFNMYPKKGRIAVGADADLVIWDGNTKRVLSASSSQSSVESSVFDGITVHATACCTIVGGKVAWQDGAMKEKNGGGFLALSANSPYLFSMVGMRDKFNNVEKIERGPTPTPAAAPAMNGHKKSGEFDRDRNRKNHMKSNLW